MILNNYKFFLLMNYFDIVNIVNCPSFIDKGTKLNKTYLSQINIHFDK
jgi:hypothetical protein